MLRKQFEDNITFSSMDKPTKSISQNNPERIQRLDLFDPSGFNRGKPKWVEIAWYLVKGFFFLSSFPWPSWLKRRILILFGAKIGEKLYIRPRVNIHFPWKLDIGDHCWIGDRCELLNLEPIVMESHVALAHDVYLAAGGHDIRSISMQYENKPIYICTGVWIATRAFVGPGVTVGRGSVVAACAVVIRDVEDFVVVAGNPARFIAHRVITKESSR